MDIPNILLEMTIYSGVIFTAVMLLKTLLKNKMSPLLHYAVWALFVVRLLVPATIASPVHLFVIPAEAPAGTLEQEAEPYSYKTVSLPENTTADTPDIQRRSDINPQYETAAAPVSISETIKPVTLSLPDILLAVWLGGIAIGLFYLLSSYCILRRNIRRSASPPSKKLLDLFKGVKAELGIKAYIKLLCLYEYGTPALMFPRTVMMPADALVAMDDEQLRFALRHELTHFKHGDHILSIFLSLLGAVYWFDPFVWLAVRQIRADMETACDGSIVKAMCSEDKRRYASLIVTLFAQPKHRQIALGMARGDTKRIAVRRVKGIFMDGSSRKSAKLISVLLALLLFIACFTTACQPTPEKPVIVPKGDDLTDVIQATTNITPEETAEGNALYALLGAPEHWDLETQTSDGKLNISAEVDIELPNVSRLPAATAELRSFSQEEIEKIVSVVLGDSLKFKEAVEFTHESLEQYTLEIQQNISQQQSGQEPDTGVYYDKKDLEYYQSLLDNTPYESELKEKDLSIETLDGDREPYSGIRVNTEVGGQSYTIRAGSIITPEAIHNISIATGTKIYGALFDGVYADEPYGVSLTKEAAAEQAKAIASQLTDELKLCYVAPSATFKEETDRNWGWACIFMREINGCPTAYATEDIGSSMESEEQKPIRYEKMVIVLDDKGVTSFKWENPMTITSIDNDNVTLMPFGEIQQYAIEGIANRLQYDAGNDPGCTARITKAELGLMRVMKANSGEYYYLPVWNFFSDIEHTQTYKDKYNKGVQETPPAVDENGDIACGVTGYPDAWGAVTINALDGSIIDRDLGY